MNLYDFRVGIFHVSKNIIHTYIKIKQQLRMNNISAKLFLKFNHGRRVTVISESSFTQ